MGISLILFKLWRLLGGCTIIQQMKELHQSTAFQEVIVSPQTARIPPHTAVRNPQSASLSGTGSTLGDPIELPCLEGSGEFPSQVIEKDNQIRAICPGRCNRQIIWEDKAWKVL